MSHLTCLACGASFANQDVQRDHFRTEWHRFNLKRKVASLPPVDLATFNTKVLPLQSTAQNEAGASSVECSICMKAYSSQSALESHLRSRKHKENEAKSQTIARGGGVHEKAPHRGARDAGAGVGVPPPAAGAAARPEPPRREFGAGIGFTIPRAVDEDAPMEEAEEEAGAEDGGRRPGETEEEMMERKIRTAKRLELEDCLFCRTRSPDFQQNVEHMTKVHGFFIPDVEYLRDVEGLVRYLGEKVAVGNVCLYCNGKGRSFHSLDAVQKHMVSKSHCKLRYEEEDEEEFGEYYDFSATWGEAGADDAMSEGGEEEDEEDEEGEGEGAWEEVGEGEDLASAVDEAQYKAERRKQRKKRPANAGQLIVMPEVKSAVDVSDEGYELILEGGQKRIGHRSLAKFYRQRYKPEETRQSVLVNQLVSAYRLLGWTTDSGRAMTMADRHEQRLAVRSKREWDFHMGMQSNHFRKDDRRNMSMANSGYALMK
eukprot:tig00020554_g10849.t1